MKNIYYIVLGLVFSFFFSACSEDWLDLEPTSSISEAQAFSTVESFNSNVIGVYDVLQSNNSFGNYAIQAAELRGEDMILKERNNWNRFKGLYQYSYIPTSSTGNIIFQSIYATIETCNSILDADAAGQVSLKEEAKNPLLAEVKALRALCYFYLVRAYCLPYQKDNGASKGIPLRVSADVSKDVGRGTVKEAYDLILSDLNFAEKYIKDQVNERVGLTFTNGLLARVHMEMGNNSEAIKYAKKAIETAPPLSSADYATGVSQENPSLIFVIKYNTNTYGQYLSYASFHDYGYADAGGYGTIGATEEMYARYEDKDLRQSWFINRWAYENAPNEKLQKYFPTWYTSIVDKIKAGNDPGTYNLLVENGLIPAKLWDASISGVNEENLKKLDRVMFDDAFYKTVSMYGKFPRLDAAKYTDRTKITDKVGTANLGYIPMMRTPELYLIVAECAALSGDDATAKAYLEKVQANANATVFNGSGSDLLDAIRLERRKELIGEGFRTFDIIRQGKVIERPKYWGPAQNATIDPTKSDSKIYFPIPQDEINSNPLITEDDQNDAYK